MKKDKNEELQSRREFFKSAAKAALPIIGAAVLASAPSIMQAAEVTGCSGCGSYCKTSCENDCFRGCEGCSASCQNSCHYSCKGRCTQTCQGTCERACKGVSYSR